MDEKQSLTNLDLGSVKSIITEQGLPAYRAGQIISAIYKRYIRTWDEISELPKTLREKLAVKFDISSLSVIKQQIAKDGTVKTLFKLWDGETVETALMLYTDGITKPRATVCVSSQVGCAVGCSFCATGQQGFKRNLRFGEITDQVLYMARYLKDRSGSGHITNIVYMGMGEPLANYDALIRSIDMITSPEAFGLGSRNITVSTAGMVPQIKQLAKDRPQIGLAVSLHAPDNVLRSRLVPLNEKYPLEVLIPACREYFNLTGRRVSFEYVLFGGVNDSLQQAQVLGDLLKGLNCHVNLIPANRTDSKVYKAPTQITVKKFKDCLTKSGITATIRQSRGQDIDAGCGQLRSKYI